jgi:hypothetical protein
LLRKSKRLGRACGTRVTFLVDGRLLTGSPPAAGALVVAVAVAPTDAIVDGAGVLVARGFGEEGARAEVAFVVVARIAEPPVSTAWVTTAAAACVATVVVRAAVDVTVEVTAVVVERTVETAAATGVVCTAGAMFASATEGVATLGAAGAGATLGVAAGVTEAAAAAMGATADCVAVATAGAAGVLGIPARATPTKAAEQARTPAQRTRRIRRLLTRVDIERLVSASSAV